MPLDSSWMDAFPEVQMPGSSAQGPQPQQTTAPVPGAQKPDYSDVIDVGGPRYSPSIPAGQQGSQLTPVAPASPGKDNIPTMRVTPQAPAKAADTSWMNAFPEVQMPSGKASAQMPPAAAAPSATAAPPPTPPVAGQQPSPPQQPSLGQTFLGSTAAALDGIPRGIVGDKVVSGVNASLQTPLRMITGMQGPISAFNEGYAKDQAQHQQLAGQYPIANAGGQVEGGMAGFILGAPALAWKAATAPGVIQKIGSAASYVARNAATGGLFSEASGDDPGEGAAIGSVFPLLHIGIPSVASEALSYLTAPFRKVVAPLVSESGRGTSVGNTLNRVVGSSPIETSPVGPLDMAQATNNPAVAQRVDIAGDFNGAAKDKLRTAQQAAVNDQIAKIGAPASAPDAAAKLSGTIRDAQTMGENQESALWNVPKLSVTTVPKAGVKQAMTAAIAKLPPGLKLGVTGNIKRALALLDSMPDQATVGDLNSVRTALRLAGRPTESNPWAPAVSNQMQSAFLDAMDNTLSHPSVDPGVASAWHEARDFTRNLRTGPLADTPMATAADEAKGASTASRGLFNFSYGSPEGPKSIADLSAWVGALKDQGAGKLSRDMIHAARSYLAANLTTAARSAEGQNLNPKMLQDFLRTNGPWMKSSGILEAPQIKAVNDLSDYVDILRRPEKLLRQVNSATSSRETQKRTFIDQVMSPAFARIGSMAAGFGLMHGNVEGLAGGLLAEPLIHQINHTESAMRELMAQALFDPDVAQGLMTKASPGNLKLMNPRARQAIVKTAQSLGSYTVPQLATSPSNVPANEGR